MKLEPGTKWSGLIIADVHAKGKIPENEKQKKDLFQSWGELDLSDFLYSSKTYPGGIALDELIMSFNCKKYTHSGFKRSISKISFWGNRNFE